ncbi:MULTISPECIES: sensor histidine kinase [unclassified Rhodococcus (in: high G+C Gram-positive bacteria)]|uniref:sensor histidine kinase n=1 Tax=unclassified Rhodococcus (in: high G+C Gram-positive bacteria) TaxID=192944 RepID=UPI000AEC7B4F|nr:sensor histidine kinase [Rhodococcus sp. M8]
MRDPSMPEPKVERVRSRLTVQSWFQVAFAVLAVFVVLGTIVGGYFIQRTAQITDELVDQIQPARAEAYRLQAALLDQETGARGYAATADVEFLEPYLTGKRVEQEAADRMREFTAGHPELLADVDEIEAAAAAWRADYADPLVASVVPGVPQPVDPASTERGRTTFDAMRTLFEAQNAELVQARAEGYDDLIHARTIRNSVLVAMVAGFLLTGLLMVILVHNLVAMPLVSLRAATRRVVADGNFDQHIRPQGPKDIRALAQDVEAMRGRIVFALAAAHTQHQRLASQKADLDAQAEELRRSNAELEQFAYVASHDLQEPLRKVASFCQLLEKRYGDKLDERGTQYIAFAVDGAKRMQVLINDLLAFSRVGRVNDAHVRVDLDQPLDKAVANLAAAVDESGARIERPEQLPEITGDPTLLTMLWQNLLGNAIKFRHPDRAPVVRITCDRIDGEDHGDRAGAGRWQLCVTDNGIGIDEEFAEKVFVIFQRLHGRDVYTGTGIGLAVCKKIVEYHGGRIWIDTEHTGGTRFCFTLPALPDEEPEEHAPADTDLEGAPA